MAFTEQSREEAKMRLAALGVTQAAILDLTNGISKWFYGSLLTVNSGGLLALINSDLKSRGYASKAALTCFLVGIFLSFLLGYFTVLRSGTANKWISRQTNILIAQITDQEVKPVDIDESAKLRKKIDTAWPSHVIGWGSAAAFLCGSTFLGFALT